ncbi:MetQ/NlpA family ABC transporter substrate-binding protein [Microaceticoccus formicicus]|uniref:MetQ/NlpA family ABC transporter substrate-binding protein n=1 Tax=Microaceticoccus formicicus TaxID=3118105 RepID=UPI003CD0366B|nr:MetQ/NlpA family ABC transporter substrate-binding protein [Peptoniphilaceae bacterium AMB_02]
MKKILLLVLVLALGLTACTGGEKKVEEKTDKVETTDKAETEKKDDKAEKVVIKIGVTPVPHAEIVELIKDDLAKEGVEVEIVEFNDYVTPNMSLADGSIDANFFQHEPYFKDMTESKNLDLVSIGNVHIEPIALYSDKYKSLEELPDGAQILIPNDPSNGSRALLLLESAGLIKLKDPSDVNATENDITDNPKNLKFTALEAASIAKAYTDADAAVINSNFAILAKLNPVEDGLIMEKVDSPYANLVAVRTADKDLEKFKKLMDALHTDKVKDFLKEKYEGAIVPAF